MSAHTPGPWAVVPFGARNWPVIAIRDTQLAPLLKIATVHHNPRAKRQADLDETRANASLIEASPDLLSVVEEAIALYGKPGGPWNIPSDPGGWINRAQDAVAKARGGER